MKLKDLVIKGGLQIGPFGSQLKASEYIETNDGVPVIMPKDMQNGQIFDKSIARISSAKSEKLKRHKLKVGDIVFGRRGEIGRCGLVTTKEDGWICGSGCLRARLSNQCSPQFFIYQIQMPHIVAWLESNAVGQTMLNLNTTILGDLPLDLPPIAEQNRIVEVLEAWDSAIALTEQLITAKQKLKKVIYQSIIPNNHRIDVSEWQWKKLGDIAYINKKSLSESTLPDFEFKYVDLSSVKQGIIKFPRRNIRFSDAPSRARRLAKKGDVLMATVRPNLQGFAYIEKLPSNDFVFSTGFAILESKKGVDARFIYQCLYSTAIQRQINARVTGSNYPAVNSSDLKSIWFPIPDDPQKQSLVVDTLEKNDSEVGLLSQYLERLRQQKQGLMQELLTGEWRVPAEEVAA